MPGLNDFPGRVNITRANITSKIAGTVSILNNILNIDVYEDIYTPYVYCEILIIDFNKLASTLPLIGEEFFLLDFQTPDGRLISYQFYLYQQDNGAITPNNKSQAYSLHGVTLERAFNTAKTVARNYKGTYASIAGQIFEDYMKKDTGLEFNFEPSKSVARYIVPQIAPLEAIDHCRRRAVPNGGVYSPYTFFRNSTGYHFVSLNSLFQMASNQTDPIVHVYGTPSPDPTTTDEESVGGRNTRNDIIAFEPANKYNTVNKIDRGTYNTISYSFDLTTKQFAQRKSFNLSENKNKFQLGSTGEYNSSDFLSTFDNSRCFVVYKPTDFSIELEGTQTDFYPDAAAEMTAYAGLMAQQQADMLLYGDSNITAGQVLSVLVYKPTDKEKTPTVDETLTGNYLLTRVKHTIAIGTNNTYELNVTGVKGSMNNTIAGLRK